MRDDLAPNELWRGKTIFEDTSPNVSNNDVASYDIWATAQAEQTTDSAGNESNGNTTSENGDGGNNSSS